MPAPALFTHERAGARPLAYHPHTYRGVADQQKDPRVLEQLRAEQGGNGGGHGAVGGVDGRGVEARVRVHETMLGGHELQVARHVKGGKVAGAQRGQVDVARAWRRRRARGAQHLAEVKQMQLLAGPRLHQVGVAQVRGQRGCAALLAAGQQQQRARRRRRPLRHVAKALQPGQHGLRLGPRQQGRWRGPRE
jgi:hypothetical protein